jgi:threonine synthase
MDPHGAVAYLGAKQYLSGINHPTNMVFLETAHPAKFSESIEQVVGKIPLPAQLQAVKDKDEHFVSISPDLDLLKELLG